MENYSNIKVNQGVKQYTVETKVHQKKEHLIVPVTMIVEGVLNGSHGSLLHLAEDFGKIPESWNGIPVVINHPEKDGVNVSANSPDVIDSVTVGRVYNTFVENNSLKGEVWLSLDDLTLISPDVLSAINMKQSIEVSVGVFTEDEDATGEYMGIQYNAIAKNHRPDHLALLPGAVGACSLVDGCGIRVNKSVKEGEIIMETEVNKKDGELDLTEEEMAKIAEEKMKNKVKINKEEKKMECTPCVKKRVDGLIVNTASGFEECDREYLETLSESKLDKLVPQTVEIEVNKGTTLSKEDQDALDFGKRQLKERRDGFINGIQANTSKEMWPDTVLSAMVDDTLERVFKSTKKETVVDYSLNGNGGFVVNNKITDSEDFLYPVGIEVK